MPLAPTPVVAVPSKPKIGFSIDSIVGGGTTSPASPAGSSPGGGRSSPIGSSPAVSPAASPASTPPQPPPPPPQLVRPAALPPGLGGLDGLKGLYIPEPLPHAPPPHHQHHPHHPLALAAAAHFQAAGLAAALAQQQPPHLGPPPPHHHPPPVPARDTYPLYPWLLSRHGRIFPHRFPAGENANYSHKSNQ